MKAYMYFVALLFAPSFLWAQQDLVKSAMKRDVQFIKGIYETAYAPADWKAQHIGWDLDREIAAAESQIDSKSNIGIKEYHAILKNIFQSMQDYHVGFSFNATEAATLPFAVKEAEGRYFIAFIDREKLSELAFPFKIGDELIQFAGKPVKEEVENILKDHHGGVAETDAALALLRLTSRSASRGISVPRGPVEIRVKPKGKDVEVGHQMIWEYKEEKVTYPLNIEPASRFNLNSEVQGVPWALKTPSILSKIRSTQFVWSDWSPAKLEDKKDEDKPKNLFQIGGKESFVPKLGAVIWENPKDKEFSARIYRNKKNQLIGYVRIPHYGGSTEKFEEFKGIIKKFTEATDALVIDEINNPGGSLFYIYALQSVLTEQVLYTPKHHIKIYPSVVGEALDGLEELKDIDNEEKAQKLLGKAWDGLPVTMQTVHFLREFSRFIIDQWDQGKTLSDPYYVWGADKVNPHKEVNYKKPILVLVNELDFSGGDFFPAILQDNGRAKILGVRTAGAGGYVLSQSFPNAFGLKSFSLTGSIAKRVNDQPIENLGVVPDIEYKLTVKDYQEGFVEYKDKINSTLIDMLKK